MDLIFHEKQEGALCAQHCLNALLQGHYYTAVDLADLAQQLDEAERRQMAEGQDPHSPEYQRFLAQPSANMDDTGFFSVQVIARAIAVWGLELVSFNSSEAIAANARRDPVIQSAFICNYREHWFTIRRIGNQWFNLNSLLTGPELVSDTYLSLFLAQLQQEGYTIYIVTGPLQDCPADSVLRLCRATQLERPKLITEQRQTQSGQQSGSRRDPRTMQSPQQPPESPQVFAPTMSEDDELQRAMALSMDQFGAAGGEPRRSEEDELQLALQLSQSLVGPERGLSDPSTPMDFPTQESSLTDQSFVMSEEDDIQRAIQMSLEKKQEDLTFSGAPKSNPTKKETHIAKSRANQSKETPKSSQQEQMYSSPSSRFSSSSYRSASAASSARSSGEPPRMATLASLKKEDSPPSHRPSAATFANDSLTRSRYANPSLPSTYTPPSRFVGRGSAAPSTYTPSSRYSESLMEQSGQRLGGVRPTGAISGAYRGIRQSTPDKDEVRQRRLAFLDKMEREKQNQPDIP
ncbi:ataxin-3-like [Tigriopus californicus]|uniref:ataxin-3-like n=1 Tax=Tigriopus californicus TaxID=6832 RepID=UPI0027DAAD49|nr:ataxin-3-like [Tigriopus californicus]